jgi:hypothetical protein
MCHKMLPDIVNISSNAVVCGTFEMELSTLSKDLYLKCNNFKMLYNSTETRQNEGNSKLPSLMQRTIQQQKNRFAAYW